MSLNRLNLEIVLLRFFGNLAKGSVSLIERSGTGICDNLYRYIEKQDLWLNPSYLYAVFRTWDEFSGDIGYPIKPSTEFEGNELEYYHHQYKWGGEQLDARRALAKHILANIDMILDANDKDYLNSQ